jgi:hypothetical protein
MRVIWETGQWGLIILTFLVQLVVFLLALVSLVKFDSVSYSSFSDTNP